MKRYSQSSLEWIILVTDKFVSSYSFYKEPQTQPWGQRTAYFTDPDGHILEVQQWIKKPI